MRWRWWPPSRSGLRGATTPSPTITPAVTAKPVTVAVDNGGLTKSKSKSRSSDDSTTSTTPTTRHEVEPGDDKGGDDHGGDDD